CPQNRAKLRKLTCRCAHPYPGAGLTDFQLEQTARRRQVIARVRRVVSPVERRQAQQKSLAKDDEQEGRTCMSKRQQRYHECAQVITRCKKSTGNPLHRAGVQSSQTRVPERSKVYGILDGRRWSVSSRNQRNSTDRCSSSSHHCVHGSGRDGQGIRREGADSAARSETDSRASNRALS